MSTPTHTPTNAGPAAPARPAVVPQPRAAAEQSAVEPAGPMAVEPVEVHPLPPPQGGEQPSVFERHAWLIPAGAIVSIVTVFVAMVLLTWIAGGNTPFNR